MRWPNLLLVALTQWCVHHYLFSNAFRQIQLHPQLTPMRLLALTFVTTCVTAAGYIINDLYDHQTDLINRPKKTWIGQSISPANARKLYLTLILLGFLPACWLAMEIGPWYHLALYPLGLTALWLYSSHLKRMGWPGNLLVSFFCAGVTAIVWLAERNTWLELSQQQNEMAKALQKLLLLYLLFAFLSNLYREWIKDLQDYKGDLQSARLTLPVRHGLTRARHYTFLAGLLFLGIVLSFALQLHFQHKHHALLFLLLFIATPLLYSLFTLFQSHHQTHYQRHARIAKFIMFAGVLLLTML